MKIENKIIYLYLQKRLLEKSKSTKPHIVMKRKTAKRIISFHIRIPRPYIQIIINDMEDIGLLKKVNKHHIQLINTKKCKKLENLNQILSHKIQKPKERGESTYGK